MDTREVFVAGIRVVFQVMENREHKKMLEEMKMKEVPEKGTTHNVSVQLIDEKKQKEIMDARVNMKVVAPDGKDQIKMLDPDEMMKYYNAYFNFSQKGVYQVLILFKTGEQKYSAGIDFEIR